MKSMGWNGPSAYAICYLTIIHFCCINNAFGETNSLVIPFIIPVNSFITKLSTSHAEFSINDKLANSLFDISKDGSLTTRKELISHAGRSFTLSQSNDNLEDQFFDTIHLKISTSWNLKSFTSQTFHGMIRENLPLDSEVRWNENISIHFDAAKFTLEPTSKHFKLKVLKSTDSSAGSQVKVVTTSETVHASDREHVFILKAWINHIDFTSTILKIKVIDANDCIPKFSKKVYHATVGGDITHAPRNSILKVSTTDQNNDKIIYSLDDSSSFYITPNSGLLFLKEVHPGFHKLKVFATDTNGNQCSAFVSIHVLSSTLKFRPFHQISKRQTKIMTVEKTYVVLENQTAGTVVFSVASKPPPPAGTEFYSILYDSIESFQVDTRGNVYLKNGLTLNYENPRHRNVTIRFKITSSLSQGITSSLK